RDPWVPRKEGRVTTFTVPFLKPATTQPIYNRLTRSGLGRRAVEGVAEIFLRRRLKALGVAKSPAIMASNIYCARALSSLSRKLLFYDFNDSPFQFAGAPEWATDYWRLMLRQVDVFFVVSEYYRRQLASQTDRPLVVIGNGVEMEHFGTPRPEPSDLAGCPRP